MHVPLLCLSVLLCILQIKDEAKMGDELVTTEPLQIHSLVCFCLLVVSFLSISVLVLLKHYCTMLATKPRMACLILIWSSLAALDLFLLGFLAVAYIYCSSKMDDVSRKSLSFSDYLNSHFSILVAMMFHFITVLITFIGGLWFFKSSLSCLKQLLLLRVCLTLVSIILLLILISLSAGVPHSSDVPTDNPPVAPQGKWMQFQDEGIVTYDAFDDYQFLAHYISNLTPVARIKLLEDRLSLVPISNTKYLIPSYLPTISPTEVRKQLPPRSSCAEPLLIHFPSGCTQNSVFCALVVYLLSKCDWKIAKGTCVFRNCVHFQLPDKPVCITLVDSLTFFELHVEAPNTMYHELCPVFQEAIFSGLKATEVLRCSDFTALPAFFCKCSSPPHAAITDDKGCYLMCTKSTKYWSLTKQHTVWLNLGKGTVIIFIVCCSLIITLQHMVVTA